MSIKDGFKFGVGLILAQASLVVLTKILEATVKKLESELKDEKDG